MIFTKDELSGMEDRDITQLSMYVDIKKGYVAKIAGSWDKWVIYNPETNHAIVYQYWESPCYVDSGDDLQYNGHYQQTCEYTPQ